MIKYDLIIIGGGGGLKLRPASELGKKVAVIEKEDLGGTCLNRGCIPSKMLIHAADVADEVRNAPHYNLKKLPTPQVNFKELFDRVTTFIQGDSKSIVKSYKKNPNVDFYHGHARFVDNQTIQVKGKKLTADKIYLAPGTRPSIPAIPGLEGTPFLTSREALRQTKQPKSMIVIGGGYIATELGHLYGALGTKVEFFVRSTLLRQEDNEVSAEFSREFTSKYKVNLHTITTRVDYKKGKFTVWGKTEQGKTIKRTAEALLVSTGIQPNTDDLGLENTSIKIDDNGYIKVDKRLQTSVKNVYALGDVIGRYFFRHSVNFEGEYLLESHYTNPSTKPIKYSPMPHAVFSSPQVAGVGATEEQLKENGIDYVKGLNHYKNSAMGDALRSEYGFAKLLFDRKTKKLLGAHIVGREASNMIHMLIAYMNMNATLDDILKTIYIHPALPEIVRNAARKAKKALLVR